MMIYTPANDTTQQSQSEDNNLNIALLRSRDANPIKIPASEQVKYRHAIALASYHTLTLG